MSRPGPHLRFPDFFSLALALQMPGFKVDGCTPDRVTRSIINRLYYSIYHNLVLAYHFHVPSDKKEHVHKELYKYLVSEGKLVIAEYFNRMRELRIDADYYILKMIDARVADKMFLLHSKAIEQMERDIPF